MTAFAFILGVVPLLTATGAGAEARKVMGMTVFSGMLIATILGVLPDSDAVRRGREGGRAIVEAGGHAARACSDSGASAGAGTGDTDNADGALLLAGLAAAALSAALAAGCAVGPELRAAETADPPQYRFVDNPAQAASLADVPWWQVFDDPALQALIREAIANNLDLRMAVARVEEARARAGIAKSFLYPQVDGVRQRANVRQASDTGDGGHDPQQRESTGSSCPGSSTCSGELRREKEAATALALASEQGRRGVLVTLVGDVASNYFLLRELDLQLDISRRTLQLNDRDGSVLPGTGSKAACRIGSRSIASVRTVRRPPPRFPRSSSRSRSSRSDLSLLLGRPPARSCARCVSSTVPLPPPIPPGLPASLLERRPDVVAGGAVPGRAPTRTSVPRRRCSFRRSA